MKKTYSILILISIVVVAACIYVVSDAQKKVELAGKIPDRLIIPVVPGQKIAPRYSCNSEEAKLPATNGTVYKNSSIGFSLELPQGWVVPSTDDNDPHFINCATHDGFEIHNSNNASWLFESEYQEYLHPKGTETIKIYDKLIPNAIVREYRIIDPEEGNTWPHWTDVLFINEKKAFFFASMNEVDQYSFISTFKLSSVQDQKNSASSTASEPAYSPVPKMNPTIVASSTNGYKLVQYSIQDSPFYKSASNCIQTDSGFKSSAKYFQHLLDSETDMRLEYQGNIVIPSLRQFTLRENDHDCFGAETAVFSWPINGNNIYFYTYYVFESDKSNPGFESLFKINLSDYSVHKLLSTNTIARSISPEDGYLYVYTPDTYSILPDREHVIKWTTTSIYSVDLNKDSVLTLYTVPDQAWLVKKLYADQDTLAKFDVKINGNRIDFGVYSKNLTASNTPVTTDQYGNYNVDWKNGVADMKFISQGSVVIPSY